MQKIRKLAFEKNRSYRTYKTYIEGTPPEVAANVMVCLVHQTNFLLDRQLNQLESQFLKHGGFTEKLYRTRLKAKRRF
jgi:four helix bundle suffix protein